MPNDGIVWDDAPAPAQAPAVPSPRAALLDALKHVESRGNPNAVSPAGAQGAYQFMPATAKAMGLKNPFDENESRAAADKLMAHLENKYGDRDIALMAYNAGEPRVDAWLKGKGKPLKPETQNYPKLVNAALEKQSGGGSSDNGIVWDDAPASAPAPKKQLSQKEASTKAGEMALEGMSGTEKFLAGAGKSLADVGRFVGLVPQDESTKAYDEALTDTGAGLAGNITGDVALTALPSTWALKAAQAPKILANATSIPGKILKHAVGGAAAGGTSELLLNRDPIQGAEFGAILNPAIVGGVRGANELLKAGQRVAAGTAGKAAEELQQKLGPRSQALVDELKKVDEIVPGEAVTAETVAGPKFPEMSVYANRSRNSELANEWLTKDAQTAAARGAALERVAAPGRSMGEDALTGSPLRSQYEEIRHVATNDMFNQAKDDIVPISKGLEAVLRGPEVAPATNAGLREFSQAVRNARQAGGPVPRMPNAGPGGQFGELTVDQLQRILKQLDMQNFNHRIAAREIKDVMRQHSPTWATAQDTFRDLSAPQNRADVASVLKDKLEAPANDMNQRLTAFTQALRDIPTTFRKADTSPRFKSMSEVFNGSPDELAAINQVEQSVKRQAAAQSIPTNSSIVGKYMNPFDLAAQETPHVLVQKVSILRSILKSLGRRGDKEVETLINKAMLDPKEMAKLIETIPPTKRNEMLNRIRELSSKQGASVPALNMSLSAGSN